MANVLMYGAQLAMLNQLLGQRLISEKEYTIIKSGLIKKYKIRQIIA